MVNPSVTYCGQFSVCKSWQVSMTGALSQSKHAGNRTEQLITYWAEFCQSSKVTNHNWVGGIGLLGFPTPEKDSFFQNKSWLVEFGDTYICEGYL